MASGKSLILLCLYQILCKTIVMEFRYKNHSCNVDVFRNNDNLVVKFFDQTKEHSADQIHDLVIVDPGYGYISLKFIGTDALLSGFLDETFFTSEEIINEAIDFVESLSEKSSGAYIPHHVVKFKRSGFVEYNGEY